MEDRSCQTARESVSGTVCHTADIQGPEAHSHDQSVPSAGGLREGKGDRSAGSRLAAEGSFLDQRNGRVTEKALDRVLDWVSGLVTVTLREPRVAVELMVMLAVS